MSRALRRTHLAIDAQVRYRADLLGADLQAVGLLLEQVAQQIGLGPWRGILAVGGAKYRAHALSGRLRPALSAAVAMIQLQGNFIRLPLQRQGGGRTSRKHGRS